MSVVPSVQDADAISSWVAGVTGGWRPHVLLVADPTVYVDGTVLVLGVPMWACLREHELAGLVQDARELAAVDDRPRVALALRVARGDIGRGLRDRTGRGDAWVSRLLVRRVQTRAVEFGHARHAWAQTLRAERGSEWEHVAEAADEVAEGRAVMVHQWLNPAIQQGVWHPDPFAGLGGFLQGCRENGVLRTEPSGSAGADAVAVLPLATYERALAELLIDHLPHEVLPTAWWDHPAAVTEPTWRAAVAAGLDAARRATGTPQTASVENMLSLVEDGWGEAIAALLTQPRFGAERDGPPATTKVLTRWLEAAISLSLLDAGAASTRWSWPYGTLLTRPDGELLAVYAVVSDALTDSDSDSINVDGAQRLRGWLHELQADVTAPLWLAGGTAPEQEQPLEAFEAYRWLRTYHVVASDRFVRLFPRGPVRAVRERTRMRMSGPGAVFEPRMQAVELGDLDGQEQALELASVVRATFSPMIGGHWWRIRVAVTL